MNSFYHDNASVITVSEPQIDNMYFGGLSFILCTVRKLVYSLLDDITARDFYFTL